MKPIRIYLADLTYDTVSLSTDAFPLSVGYIAAYCKKKFGEKIEIELFKYIEELKDALKKSAPDILGLSNYAWNEKIGLEMFQIGKSRNNNMISVWGGPNFPLDFPSQKKFLLKHDIVDIYVPIEGEVGFSNIVESMINVKKNNCVRDIVLSKPIDGCIVRNNDKVLNFSGPGLRTTDLDEIPSPYLVGLMDKFFDGRLSPMIQTNRGCPFQCTFCNDGVDSANKVNQFSMERVTSEINYIGERIPKKSSLLIIADLNFGMMPRDKQICEAIAQIQQRFNYPKKIDVSTGKNSRDRIVDAIKILNGALAMKLSVQSTDEDVLVNVKRSNISTEQTYKLIAPAIKESKIPSQTEIIIGLPGDSYETNINTIKDMMKIDVDEYLIYTLMLLNGSELNTPLERKKWEFRTKFRVLPRSFAKLENNKKILEIEEVVIASNTLSFEDYVKLRLLAFSVFVTNQISYKPITKYLRQNDIDIFDLFSRPLESNTLPSNIEKLFDQFKNSTIKELWNSPEEIIEHFQNDKEYKKLLNDELGFNVMQFFYARVVTEFLSDWTEYVINSTKTILQEKGIFTNSKMEEFNDIGNYCRGLTSNPLNLVSKDHQKFIFKYDVQNWFEDNSDKMINEFQFKKQKKFEFCYSAEEIELFQNNMSIYGSTANGMSQVLKRIPKQLLWRHPITVTN